MEYLQARYSLMNKIILNRIPCHLIKDDSYQADPWKLTIVTFLANLLKTVIVTATHGFTLLTIARSACIIISKLCKTSYWHVD